VVAGRRSTTAATKSIPLRYVMLFVLPDGHSAEAVRTALADNVQQTARISPSAKHHSPRCWRVAVAVIGRLADHCFYGVLKLAVPDRVPFILSLQVRLLPLRAPDQPVNVDPTAADAVNVTTVPSGYVGHVSEQSPGQLIPEGEDVTDPRSQEVKGSGPISSPWLRTRRQAAVATIERASPGWWASPSTNIRTRWPSE